MDDTTFLTEILTEAVTDLLPSPDMALTSGIDEAIQMLVDEIMAVRDNYPLRPYFPEGAENE